MNQSRAKDQTPSPRSWVFLMLLTLIWGTSFILIKRGLVAFDPITSGILRPTIASIVMVMIIPFVKLKHTSKKKLLLIFFSGVIGIFIPSMFFSFAQGNQLPSAVAGSINAITPLVVFIIGVLFFGVKFSRIKFIGLIIGLIGALLLILGNPFDWLDPQGSALNAINYAGFFIVVANLLYGVNSNILKNYLGDVNPLVVAVYSVAFLAPVGLTALFGFSDFLYIMEHHPKEATTSLLYICVLAVLGTALASFIFNLLIQKTSAVFATSVTYFIPIVAIFFGVFDGEAFQWYHIIGVIIILLGVFISNRKGR